VVEWNLGPPRFAACCWHPLRDSWVWVEVVPGRCQVQPSVGDSLSKGDSVKCEGRDENQVLMLYYKDKVYLTLADLFLFVY